MTRLRTTSLLWVYLVVFLAMPLLPSTAVAQTIEWIRQFGTTSYDTANAVAVDATGVYVAGSTGGALPGQTGAGAVDAYVRKYDFSGVEQWTRQFGSTGNDAARGVAVDATGVYVAGTTGGALPGQFSAGNSDAFVRKYDANGNLLWTRQFGFAEYDSAAAVAAEANGVYVAGTNTNVTAGEGHSYVRKYDTNGNLLWTRQIVHLDHNSAWGAAVDGTGVYIVGDIRRLQPGAIATDVLVLKYDSNGNALWTHQFGPDFVAGARGVGVNASGVYLVGYTFPALPGQTSAGDAEILLRKYDTNGTEQWTRQFGSANGDFADGVALDSTSAYVAGWTRGALPGQTSLGGFSDAYVRKYDANGAELWTRQFGSVADDSAAGVAVGAGATGVYVVGSTGGALLGQTNAGGLGDAFVVKLSATTTPTPSVSDGGVVNNGSFAASPAPVAPGSIAAVFGSNLNDGSTVLSSSFASDGRLVTNLGGASVRINNIAAPIFYSTRGQLGVQIPFELAGQTSATIQVTVGGQTSVSRTISLNALAPGIFTANNQGTGAAAVLHEDGVTPVHAENPARPGEVVILYATGLGAVTPPLATGAPSTGNVTAATATVLIDGVAAEVQFSGTAPGFVGLNQINVRIPASTRAAADIPVVLSVGGVSSNTATIAVR